MEGVPEDESKDKGGLFLQRMMKLARTYSFSLRNDSYYTPFLYEALKEYTDLRDSRSEQMAFVKKKILAVKRIVAVRDHDISFLQSLSDVYYDMLWFIIVVKDD